MTRIAGMVLIFLLQSGGPSAAKAEDPLKTLDSIEHFAFGGIGFAGTTSSGEVAFRKILSRRTAAADFHRLLQSGNAQGKCYALAGLRATRPDDFAAAAAPIARSRVPVVTAEGCEIATSSLADVIKRLKAGRYDRYLVPPSQ